MSSSSISDQTPTITNAHFSHIQFSDQPRRFPGEATDTLLPSSPPSSDDEDEPEPVDLEYFEKSRSLANVLMTTIKILEQKIESWELYYDTAEKEKGRLQHRVDNIREVWKRYQETVETLSETQDALEELQQQSALELNKLSHEFDLECEELRAQVNSLSHQRDVLISENSELKENIEDAERSLDRYRQYAEG
ncbi:hypothetical protein AAF712_015133 [Marasmius tenuissimus]|uniref:Uncharacterized protein n=1 Tax=Marasmius tenuissimus TaxID=585030 RepID=A0ABR2Z942_9AGAR